jgi:pantoate--beta-alanine ligase
MPKHPPVARSLTALHRAIDQLRTDGAKVALVPTMGALHDGHLTLVDEAKRKADRVIVSIFVNPAQFAPHEDFNSYPRTLNTDLAKLAPEGVDLVWAPNGAVMYPDGYVSRIGLDGPAVAGLEDTYRPHFFGGVATVVGKLFNQCRPDFAMFGEKDYQQLKVVTRMAKDLDMRVKVVGVPTVREPDGLAMSSRNAYLSSEERKTATVLIKEMKAAASQIKRGTTIEAALKAGRKAIADAGFALDYLDVRHAENLAPVKSAKDGPLRMLVAAKIGRTRLIDNIKV